MIVGIPKELLQSEERVAATPKTVTRLMKQGFEVVIEKGAGDKANYSDAAFNEAGAKIANTAAEIFNLANIIE